MNGGEVEMIDKKKVIEILWDWHYRVPGCTDEYDALMDAIALLKEQEAVVPKWTSIKERYPEKEGFYLVSAEHGNYHPWIAEMRIFAGVKGFCNGAVMPVVGAWMPLPAPYMEGQ